MKRKVSSQLLKWKNSLQRKPLLMYGARQVGKTYVANEFGREHYDNVVYVNFETNVTVAADFSKDIVPEKIIDRLEIFYKQKIFPEKTDRKNTRLNSSH